MKRKAGNQPGAAFKKPRMSRQPSVVLGDVIMADVRRGRKSSPVGLAAEKKFFDSITVTDATTTASVLSLNNMGAGDTALLRDGNKILCLSVQLRGSFQLESLAANSIVRYMVIHDKNANGTAPTAAQVFEGTPAVTALKSIGNASRFTTLLDKTIVINNQSDTAGAMAKAYVSEYIKVPRDLQLAAFTDGTAAVPISGSLSLLIIGDIAAGAADVDVVMSTRIRFIG